LCRIPYNKRILRARSSGVPVWDQLLSVRWASARRKSASRYAAFVARPSQNPMTLIAGFIVVSIGVGFLAFSVVAIFRAESAREFLQLFANSRQAHFVEQGIRLFAGASLVVYSPVTSAPSLYLIFGIALISTSVLLMILPWRWHQWFANLVIPYVTKYLVFFAICTAILGVAVLYGVLP